MNSAMTHALFLCVSAIFTDSPAETVHYFVYKKNTKNPDYPLSDPPSTHAKFDKVAFITLGGVRGHLDIHTRIHTYTQTHNTHTQTPQLLYNMDYYYYSLIIVIANQQPVVFAL